MTSVNYVKLLKEKILSRNSKIITLHYWYGSCSDAHYWPIEFTKLSFDVRIMAVKFVSPYRQNEIIDAKKAICEAVTRPKTHSVSLKSEDQQLEH